MSEQPGPATVIRRFTGNALLAIGVLWMSVSGICSAWMLGITLTENHSFSDFLSSLWIILLVGGISIGIGYVIVVVGQAIRPKS